MRRKRQNAIRISTHNTFHTSQAWFILTVLCCPNSRSHLDIIVKTASKTEVNDLDMAKLSLLLKQNIVRLGIQATKPRKD